MCVYEKEPNLDDQIVQYNEVLDKIDEALSELIKADQDFGLTDLQGQFNSRNTTPWLATCDLER